MCMYLYSFFLFLRAKAKSKQFQILSCPTIIWAEDARLKKVWEKISVYRSKICFLHNEGKAKNTLTHVTVALQTEPLCQTALPLLVLVGIPLAHQAAKLCHKFPTFQSGCWVEQSIIPLLIMPGGTWRSLVGWDEADYLPSACSMQDLLEYILFVWNTECEKACKIPHRLFGY